ncbi:MAG: hypothetical protein ACI84O_001129 [Myxococcota bacterium]|jgi:hypothetical protein
MPLSLFLSCFTLISAQNADVIQHRFSQLDESQQLEIIGDYKNELLASENIVVRRAGELLELEYAKTEWKAIHRLYTFDDKEYAPKLKLKYRELNSRQSKWKKIGRVALPGGVPEEAPALRYDYASKGLFSPEIDSWGNNLSLFTSGDWVELTEFSARCEGVLDHDESIAKIADYFSHTYRDRDGNVYVGIRLFDIWNAEADFGISDTESVAFLRNILDEHRIESPIDDRYHAKLYERMSEYFGRWREYQQLRHTLASLQINPNAKIDLLYEGLRDYFNMAWRMLQFDPQQMAEFLKKHPTRDEFSAAIAKDLQGVIQPQLNLPLPSNYAENKLASEGAVTEIKLLANKVLRAHGLLGMRR